MFSEGEKPGLGHLTSLGCISTSPFTSCPSVANDPVSLDLSFHFRVIEMAVPPHRRMAWALEDVKGPAQCPVPCSCSVNGHFLSLFWFSGPMPSLEKKKPAGQCLEEEIIIWFVTKIYLRICYGTQGPWGKSKKLLLYSSSSWSVVLSPTVSSPGKSSEMQILRHHRRLVSWELWE